MHLPAGFNDFIKRQESNKVFWAALSILGHGTVFTTATLFIVAYTGNHFIFWAIAVINMVVAMIPNIAAMPVKVVVPVFFGSLLVDVGIIVACLLSLL